MRSYKFKFTYSYNLRLDQIWPDGDHPNILPSTDHIMHEIEQCGGIKKVIRDWGLDGRNSGNIKLDVTVNCPLKDLNV